MQTFGSWFHATSALSHLSKIFRSPFLKSSNRRVRRRPNREFLLELVPKGSICAEIGVYKGEFSRKILDVVRPERLHLIDPWKYFETRTYAQSLYGGKKGKSQENMDQVFLGVAQRFEREIQGNQVVLHRACSSDVSSEFPDEYFDWIYIDGNHLYEFVKEDLEMYHPKVKRGGQIVGDDYSDGGWFQGGVKRAVDEFVINAEIESLRIQDEQYFLQKRCA